MEIDAIDATKKRASIRSMLNKNSTKKTTEESIHLTQYPSTSSYSRQSSSNFAQDFMMISKRDSQQKSSRKSCKSNGNIDTAIKNNLNQSESNDDYEQYSKSPANGSMHKFYITRLKHSLIVSFLLLIPIQNCFLLILSQFSELVRFFYFYFFRKNLKNVLKG